MNLLFYLKVYYLLHRKELLTIAGAVLVISALAALLIIRLVRKKKEASASRDMQLPEDAQNAKPPAAVKSPKLFAAAQSSQLPPSAARPVVPMSEAGCRMSADPRTVLMSYSTVVLRDALSRNRCYRADLIRPVTVGRSSENAICIADDSVSRRHLRIYRDGGVVMVENLSEKNGTLLEGVRLAGARELTTGSILQLGRVKLLAEID